jgi:hypothetical protein
MYFLEEREFEWHESLRAPNGIPSYLAQRSTPVEQNRENKSPDKFETLQDGRQDPNRYYIFDQKYIVWC